MPPGLHPRAQLPGCNPGRCGINNNPSPFNVGDGDVPATSLHGSSGKYTLFLLSLLTIFWDLGGRAGVTVGVQDFKFKPSSSGCLMLRLAGFLRLARALCVSGRWRSHDLPAANVTVATSKSSQADPTQTWTLPDQKLHYQDALDWREWIKSWCSFPFQPPQ